MGGVGGIHCNKIIKKVINETVVVFIHIFKQNSVELIVSACDDPEQSGHAAADENGTKSFPNNKWNHKVGQMYPVIFYVLSFPCRCVPIFLHSLVLWIFCGKNSLASSWMIWKALYCLQEFSKSLSQRLCMHTITKYNNQMVGLNLEKGIWISIEMCESLQLNNFFLLLVILHKFERLEIYFICQVFLLAVNFKIKSWFETACLVIFRQISVIMLDSYTMAEK